MIRFPLLESLSVSRYGLYPGTPDRPGLDVDFRPGLTLVLGANGLGKSTLVLLLYRMCTGPNDIRGLTQGDLGSRQFNVGSLSYAEKRPFAARVHDNAANATALLVLRLGEKVIEINRELRGLSLMSLTVNGDAVSPDEETFQQEIVEASGLVSFADWILLLLYLTFYTTDRRSLVWDESAQRQVLRFLFLPPEESARSSELEREVLKLDSHVRNLQAMLSREESILVSEEKAAKSTPGLESELGTLAGKQNVDQSQLEIANERFSQLESERQSARLEALRAAEARESIYREIEHLRLERLRASFPSKTESLEYILSYLLAGDVCLSCGSEVSEVSVNLRQRVDRGRCPICDSPTHVPATDEEIAGTPTLVDLQRRLGDLDTRLYEATKRRSQADSEHSRFLGEIATLRSRISERSAEMDNLIKRLPAGDRPIKARRKEYNAMRSSLEQRKDELSTLRRQLAEYVSRVQEKIISRRDEVKNSFDRFAADFLLESCSLIASTHKGRVGQSGETIDFAVFEVDMATSTDSDAIVRRNNREQVSESQSEFIDLAFRMALMQVAGWQEHGTLVIDAPESSLDAVFAPRAANVLMRFGDEARGNRLVVTSNLIDGKLIPTLLRRANVSTVTDERVVDLFEIAAPTAAVRQLREEYDAVLSGLFEATK